jgi:hypothetical protein
MHYHGFWVIDWFRLTPKAQIDSLIRQLSLFVDNNNLSATVAGTFLIEHFQKAFKAAS